MSASARGACEPKGASPGLDGRGKFCSLQFAVISYQLYLKSEV